MPTAVISPLAAVISPVDRVGVRQWAYRSEENLDEGDPFGRLAATWGGRREEDAITRCHAEASRHRASIQQRISPGRIGGGKLSRSSVV